MTEKHLKLPFVTKAKDPKEAIAFATEIACVACIAELQRKKTGFLRDTPEKIAFISKINYPLWVVSAENQSIALDGLGFAAHKFSFKEPDKIEQFVEDLRMNSATSEDFMNSLKTQVNKVKEFTSTIKLDFANVFSDSELLSFLPEYFKTGTLLSQNEEGKSTVIPPEIGADTAVGATKAVTECLRTIQADNKGLQYALHVLNEEVEFHKRVAASETERLKEKCEAETGLLRPVVEKAVKKLTQKHDRTFASLTKTNERKLAALQKKHEACMHKLDAAEKKKDAAQHRISHAKKKSSKPTYSLYEVKRYDREIETAKKAAKAAKEVLEKTTKENESRMKLLEEEFKSAVATEEAKITSITTVCEAKVTEKRKQIETMTAQAASIIGNVENLMDELKRSAAALRQQVMVDWKLDNTEDIMLARVPVYLIKYLKGNGERFGLFSPVTIAEEVSVLNGLKKILTFSSEPKLKTLTRPTSKKLHEILTASLVDKMQTDEVFKNKISAVCRSNNLLDQMDFGETLNQGLDEIAKFEWLTTQEASALCKQIMEEIA